MDAEKAFLAVFIALFLYFGPGIVFSHSINHAYPWAIQASDAFQHQARVESIKAMGNYYNEASWISAGFDDAVGFYPPLMYHAAILFSNLGGMETYDGLYLFVFLSVLLSILLLYICIKRFDSVIAILSLPLTFLLFSVAENHVGPLQSFTFGVWPAFIGHLFLIALLWALLNIELERSYILLALVMSGMALGHTSELIIGILFIAVYLVFEYVIRQLSVSKLKTIIIAGGISFLVSLYYLIIFKYTWAYVQPFKFEVQSTTSDPTLYLADLSILLAVLGIGLILAIISFAKKRHLVLLFSFFALLVSFSNYIGFGRHAFRIRAFWPVYLAVFFGFALYYGGKLLVKEWKELYAGAASLLMIALILAGIPLIPQLPLEPAGSIMDQYHWDMFDWIKSNTEKEATIFYFYGDIYQHNALLRNSERRNVEINRNEYIEALQSGNLNRFMNATIHGDGGGVWYAYRDGLFDYGYHLTEKGRDYFYGQKDLCGFEYYVFDKGTSIQQLQPLIEANMAIAQTYANAGMEGVFQNEVVLVLKNNNVGGDCFAQKA
ncbi:MAG TPA: hypothetical protein VJI46_03430 [Candidatus Nanoarchaeia archaeon]|nr:hypothetical protein [Candidatus Nanoarchaeia archaeon]